MKISFCNYNEAVEKLYDRLKENYPELELTRNKCIGACDKCGCEPMVRVDGTLVTDKDCEVLYNKIINMVLNK